MLAACALAASAQCSSYGSQSSGGAAAAAASFLNAQSYALGANQVDSDPAYAAASAPSPSYPPQSQRSKPDVSMQPLWSHEIYPGRTQYKTYHSAPQYSQITLPIISSSPLARLFESQSQSQSQGQSGGYGGSSGASSGSSY